MEKIYLSRELSLETRKTSKVMALDRPDMVAVILDKIVMLTTIIWEARAQQVSSSRTGPFCPVFSFFPFFIFSLHAFVHSDGLIHRHRVKLDALICKTAPGIGSLHAWQVRFGRQIWKNNAVPATVMSYFPPMITAMDSSQWPFDFTEGGSVVSIIGKFFGPPSSERGVGGIGNVVYGNSQQFELASRVLPEGRWQYFAPFLLHLLNYLIFCV